MPPRYPAGLRPGGCSAAPHDERTGSPNCRDGERNPPPASQQHCRLQPLRHTGIDAAVRILGRWIAHRVADRGSGLSRARGASGRLCVPAIDRLASTNSAGRTGLAESLRNVVLQRGDPETDVVELSVFELPTPLDVSRHAKAGEIAILAAAADKGSERRPPAADVPVTLTRPTEELSLLVHLHHRARRQTARGKVHPRRPGVDRFEPYCVAEQAKWKPRNLHQPRRAFANRITKISADR